MNFLAHVGQSLPAHLAAVAKRAESFAMEFGSGAAGWLAGIHHDLGKAEAEFQKRIMSNDRHGKRKRTLITAFLKMVFDQPRCDLGEILNWG